MPPQKNYYQILGLPRTATEDEIKRRYRQLVRQYHPDVAEDKALSKTMFLQIAEAYQTLSNPDRRVIYDASIDMQSYRPHSASRPSANPRSSYRPPTQQARPAESHAQAQARQEAQRQKSAEVDKWMREARAAFASAQFRSAVYACKEAVKLDSRNVEAYIIMGDVYRNQGNLDNAMAMYSMAAQFDPYNIEVKAKLDRLVRSNVAPEAEKPSEKVMSLRIGLTMIGVAVVGFIFYFLACKPGEPVQWIEENISVIGSWSSFLMIALGIGGLVSGFLLSVNDSVRQLDDELVFPSVHSAGLRRVSYPMGLLLLVFSLINFYFAAGVYLLLGVLQESLSKSVVRTFGATVVVSLVGAIVYSPGHMQVVYFGGNLVFPCVLLGWMIGDMFRSPW